MKAFLLLLHLPMAFRHFFYLDIYLQGALAYLYRRVRGAAAALAASYVVLEGHPPLSLRARSANQHPPRHRARSRAQGIARAVYRARSPSSSTTYRLRPGQGGAQHRTFPAPFARVASALAQTARAARAAPRADARRAPPPGMKSPIHAARGICTCNLPRHSASLYLYHISRGRRLP